MRQCTRPNFGEPVAEAVARIKNETQKPDPVAKNVPKKEAHKLFGLLPYRVSTFVRCQEVRLAVRFYFDTL